MDYNLYYEYFYKIVKNYNSSLRKTAINNGRNCIIGFYNQPKIHHKKYFTGKKGSFCCRKCRYNIFPDYIYKLFTLLSEIYKELDPIEYELQKSEYDKIDPDFKIPNSIFTTCTINYNVKCHPHVDVGNYRDKSLIFCMGDFQGGSLIINNQEHILKQGTVMLIDGNLEHYNTPIIKGNKLSIVLYIRSNMTNEMNPNKIKIDKDDYRF